MYTTCVLVLHTSARLFYTTLLIQKKPVYSPPIRGTNSLFGDLSLKWVTFLVGCGYAWETFNTILDQGEKRGGKPFFSSFDDVFRSFINHFGMINLGFFSNPFTWTDNRQGFTDIKERLDRGIAAQQWLLLFPTSPVLHVLTTSSYHHSTILNAATNYPVLSRPFRFEEFLTRDSSSAPTKL